MAKILLVFLSLPTFSWAFDAKFDVNPVKYGTLELHDLGINIDIDVTQEVKAVNIHGDSRDSRIHNFSAGIMFKDNGRTSASLFRSKYLLNLPLILGNWSGIYSESSLAFGFLDAKYLSQGNRSARFEHSQILSGISEYLQLQIKTPDHSAFLKVGGQSVFSSLNDNYGNWTDWDNFGFGFQGGLKSRLSGLAIARLNIEGMRKRHNPEKYFFVEKWTQELSVLADLAVSPASRLELGPLVNYKQWDIERDGKVDLKKYEIGWKLIIRELLPGKIGLSGQALCGKWLHKEGREYLVSLGFISQKTNLELYQKRVEDKFSKEILSGFIFSWKFGTGKRSENLAELDRYGYAAERKYEFYRKNGLRDNQSLSPKEQAERLNSVRKRNEWSGKNLAWKEAPDNGWGFRDGNETYASRGGDCDEQACLNSYLDKLNGYKSNVLAWWGSGNPIGHAVQLVQDKTSGQWFMDEYGLLYKLDVPPNADRETVALAALKQTNRFTALPIENNASVLYSVINCDAPGTYQFLSFTSVDNFQSPYRRPPIEYGYELFTGRDVLFK